MRRHDLPPGLVLEPRGEELCEPHMLANGRAQALTTVHAQDEPELERAKAPAERRPVVLQVDRAFRRGEIFGTSREGGMQRLRLARPEDRAVERGEQPLVRVDDDRVGQLDTSETPAMLGT